MKDMEQELLSAMQRIMETAQLCDTLQQLALLADAQEHLAQVAKIIKTIHTIR